MAAGVTYFAFLGAVPGAAAGRVDLRAGARRRRPAPGAAVRRDPGGVPRGDSASSWCDEVAPPIDSAGVTGRDRAGRLPATPGCGAVDKLRIGMELIWKGQVDPPDVLARQPEGPGRAARRSAASGWSASGSPAAVTAGDVLGAGAARPGRRARLRRAHRVVGHRAGGGGGRRHLPVAAAGACPSISHPLRLLLPGAVFGAVGLRGAEARRRLLPVADRRQRDRVGLRRGRRAARLDQRGRPVRLLHGRVDGDTPRSSSRPVAVPTPSARSCRRLPARPTGPDVGSVAGAAGLACWRWGPGGRAGGRLLRRAGGRATTGCSARRRRARWRPR